MRERSATASTDAPSCRARQWDLPLLDAQVTNPHLLGLGAVEMPRAQFVAQARALAAQAFDAGAWRRFEPMPAIALLD